MSAYILYQNQTIPEKWGGSLGSHEPAHTTSNAPWGQAAARPTTRWAMHGLCIAARASLLSGWAPAAGHFYSGSLPQKATNGARVLSQVHDLGISRA